MRQASGWGDRPAPPRAGQGSPGPPSSFHKSCLQETSAAYGQEACVLCQAGDTGMWRGQEISSSGNSEDLSIWNSSTLKWRVMGAGGGRGSDVLVP